MYTNTQYALQLASEAVIVGLVTLVIGTLIIEFLRYLQSRWNGECLCSMPSRGIITGGLFLTGFLAHFLFEAAGINRSYLTKSAAAKRAAAEAQGQEP